MDKILICNAANYCCQHFVIDNSIITELHFEAICRSLSSKFWRKELYQLYLLKGFYAVEEKDHFQIFTFAIIPKC